jgi:hypothetical protein
MDVIIARLATCRRLRRGLSNQPMVLKVLSVVPACGTMSNKNKAKATVSAAALPTANHHALTEKDASAETASKQ